jgi:hypothetical protein
MTEVGNIQYRVKCARCGSRFTVDDISFKLPKHPPKGEWTVSDLPYVPCLGSGTAGMYVDTIIKGW